MSLADRIMNVEQRLSDACARSGRSRTELQVIAVTKYVSLDTAVQALHQGLTHLGENRWQDAQSKWQAISGELATSAEASTAPTWHFIGSLQTNKVKEVVGRFAYIHSLDRLSLAQGIEKRAQQLGISVPCFIQVNVAGEHSKHGLAPEQLFSFAAELANFQHVSIAGLMTMAPHEEDPEQTRPVFRTLRALRDELNARSILRDQVQGLSMGMSNDFEVAVEEGANWLRLGTILVGKEEER